MFHVLLLSPYVENTVHGPNYPQPPPDIIDGEPEWEIERIIGHREQRTSTIISSGKVTRRPHGNLWTTCKILKNQSTITGKGRKRGHKTNHPIQ
jgi:hypothetical protein